MRTCSNSTVKVAGANNNQHIALLTLKCSYILRYNVHLHLQPTNNKNTQKAALAIMPSTMHPYVSAEPSLHEYTNERSSAIHNNQFIQLTQIPVY